MVRGKSRLTGAEICRAQPVSMGDRMLASAAQSACTIHEFQRHRKQPIMEMVLQAIVGARVNREELCSQ